MAPDLITLGVICHEESVHIVFKPTPSLMPARTVQVPIPLTEAGTFTIPQGELNSSGAAGSGASELRTRSLASMYSTGFVFNQNQQNLVKALPWSNRKCPSTSMMATSPNMMPSPSDMQKMIHQYAQSHVNGSRIVGDAPVPSLQNGKVRAEHAASIFALLS